MNMVSFVEGQVSHVMCFGKLHGRQHQITTRQMAMITCGSKLIVRPNFGKVVDTFWFWRTAIKPWQRSQDSTVTRHRVAGRW